MYYKNIDDIEFRATKLVNQKKITDGIDVNPEQSCHTS